MTDYDDRENSTDQGSPVEMYEFVGSYRSYFMTDDKLPQIFASKLYGSVPGLERNEIKIATHEDDDTDLEVRIPISEQLVKDYGFQTTPPDLDLLIHRTHRGSATVIDYWKGKVAAIEISGNFAILRVPSKFGVVLQGNIPNVYIQPSCNNVLFDARCKVSRVSNSLDTTVVSVDNRIVTIPNTGSFPDGWFIGGEIAIPSRNERRMIVAQAGGTLTVNYPFARMSNGSSIQVTAGCDHDYNSERGCPKFANRRNFGGAPLVPGETKNPFTAGVR